MKNFKTISYAITTNVTDNSIKFPGLYQCMRQIRLIFNFFFSAFCVFLWLLDDYAVYGVFTLAMLVVFEALQVSLMVRTLKEISDMGSKPYNINVYRNRRWRHILSSELCPGMRRHHTKIQMTIILTNSLGPKKCFAIQFSLWSLTNLLLKELNILFFYRRNFVSRVC